ncbi:MAG: hypothetical protein J7K37_00230, partial [Candidatus Omnitrophica bacterium]|nr:hypothetical protein [Candidatus Omnitrophota bacterium]
FLATVIALAFLGLFFNFYLNKRKTFSHQEIEILPYPPEIDSILIINNNKTLQYLQKKFPLILNVSSRGLIINFKKPLNLSQKIIKIYFENPLQQTKLILKDSFYYSNSQSPLLIDTNQEKVLQINSKNLSLGEKGLNPYRIAQLRLEFKKPLCGGKIKNIKIENLPKGG